VWFHLLLAAFHENPPVVVKLTSEKDGWSVLKQLDSPHSPWPSGQGLFLFLAVGLVAVAAPDDGLYVAETASVSPPF
jgi:hypothetical protein